MVMQPMNAQPMKVTPLNAQPVAAQPIKVPYRPNIIAITIKGDINSYLGHI